MDVVLLPGGEVLGVKTRKASAMSAWDNAVERAILKAQPLPLPPDPAMFKEFRELNLKIQTQGVDQGRGYPRLLFEDRARQHGRGGEGHAGQL